MNTTVHATLVIEDFPHAGDCVATLCPECGCCGHCPEDGHCPGCDDRLCGCGDINAYAAEQALAGDGHEAGR